MTHDKPIGERILRYRTEHGISQDEFAKRVGVHRLTIQRLEHDLTANYTLKTALRIEKVMDPDFTYDDLRQK